MEKVCNTTEVRRRNEKSFKAYKDDDDSNREMLRASSAPYWYYDADPRQRWSYGSDTSIEAAENIQNRLCCSPVDEYDCTTNSEIDGLIVNNIDDRDERCKNYATEFRPCSPEFENIITNDEEDDLNDVNTADDELIDYSKRYTTDSTMSVTSSKRIDQPNIQQISPRNINRNTLTRKVPVKKNQLQSNRSKQYTYGDYAETDLDQPTNYSLRYAEHDTDEDKKVQQFYNAAEHEDSIQTYCTEGTPNNFSTSTSMSDLLALEDGQEREEIFKRPILSEQKRNICNKSKNVCQKNQSKEEIVSVDSKPIGDKQNRDPHHKKNNERKYNKHTPPQSPAELCYKDKENKVVAFHVHEENSPQQTPLMFSRTSSLDSLSEFEQHSIHDECSSVFSDLSHRTSAVVSPSELPDSPTQTVPPSPHILKSQIIQNKHEYQQKGLLKNPSICKPVVQHQCIDHKIVIASGRSTTTRIPSNSVFADNVVAFQEESMPYSSTASIAGSTLSALTIDDENEYDQCDNHEIIRRIAAIRVRTSAAGMHLAPIKKQQIQQRHEFSGSEKFQKTIKNIRVVNKQLAGFKNNYASPVKQEIQFVKVHKEEVPHSNIHNDQKLQNNKCPEHFKESWYSNDLNNENRNRFNNQPQTKTALEKRFSIPQKIEPDEVRIYCTEDTPTYISPFGSESNLSALSIMSYSDENVDEHANIFDQRQQQHQISDEEEPAIGVYDSDEIISPNGSVYSEGEDNDRRIDVSPFDSQLNLVNFSLLRIEEEDENEEEEKEEVTVKVDHLNSNDKIFNVNNGNRYDRFSPASDAISGENELSDEDQKVLEECIKSGVSKLTSKRR
ncbi:hypothetical protein TKK_0001030 [Trichogramma kaykai]|uniref:Uncharacterized protein n=1 Tax=Trichogramma kaykai TaxID=54128 RepID=A0ABD2WRV0_9HYME